MTAPKPKRSTSKAATGRKRADNSTRGRGGGQKNPPAGTSGKTRRAAQLTRRHEGKPVLDLHATVAYGPAPAEGAEREALSIIDVAADTFRYYGTWPDAAARCGMHVDTLRSYVEHGARVRRNLLAGEMTAGDLRAHDRQCVELLERIERAQADGARMLTQVLARSAEGYQLPEEVHTTKVADEVTKVVTVQRHAQPDPRSAMWLLERTRPADYGRTRVEVTGADGAPLVDLDKPLDRLVTLLDSIRANRAAAPTAAEAEAHMTPTPKGPTP